MGEDQMSYNLILITATVIAVVVGIRLGKGGPKWKAPMIAVLIFVVAMIIVNYLGLAS